MAKLEIRDLFLDPAKPNDPPRWETAELNVEVDSGDYKVIRSKVGRKLIYTIKYGMVEDAQFRESGTAPSGGETPKRWDKMYRCHFNLNYKRPTEQGQPLGSPISNEENVTYPNLFPEIISTQAPPQGTQWPKDPFYRLYKNYKYPDPTQDAFLDKCAAQYVGQPHVFIQKLVSLLTVIDLEQKIRLPGEVAPPTPPAGQSESEEETAKRLKNFIKTNSIGGQLRAKYQILTVQQEGEPLACAIKKIEEKTIALRGLGCTEENKEETEVADLAIIRF